MYNLVTTLFAQQIALNPGKIAVHEDNKEISYIDLDQQAQSLAGVLQNIGLARETVVAVLLPSGISLVTALLANFKAGTVYMPLNMAFGRRRLDEIFKLTGCNTIITNSTLKPQITALLHDLNISVDTLIITDDAAIEVSKNNNGSYEKFEVDYSAQMDVWSPGPNDSNYIFCTSGTTGSGKAILGNHKGLANFINWEIKEFSINADFRVSQLTSTTFDASLRDVFAALCSGGTLYIPSDEIRINTAALIEWLDKNQISLVHCVPSLFKLITKELAAATKGSKPLLKNLKYIIMAGEPLYSKDIKSWRDAAGEGTELVTMYGTSETTLAKTFHRMRDIPENPSQLMHVGKPIDEAHIMIVNNNELCRIGEIGEVYIKSFSFTKGYYNNKALTDTVFVQNPLHSEKDIVYKTGDLGKYLKDRNVEIIGRIDDQVKINGIRVELKEIEQAVLSLDGVSEAVIIAHKDKAQQTDLLCYYIGNNIDESYLRAYLEKELPQNLLPSFFVKMDTFPLTLNGKIDKKALPKPEEFMSKQFEYEAPQNEIEKELENIWEGVLGIKNIGRKASFFEIGGNSLKSLMIVSKIYKQYNVLIKLDVIFTHRTIAELAAYIADANKQTFKTIQKLPVKEYYDLSNSQKRAWISNQTATEKALYNVASAYLFEGDINLTAFKKSFETLVNRHEILRTTFALVDGNPQQKVNDYNDEINGINYIDLRAVPNSEDEAKAIMTKESNTAFDLENGPLFKGTFLHLADAKFIFVFTIHHIVSDGWSMEVLTNDMFVLYNAYCNNNENPLKPLSIQYKDYADWQNKQLADTETNNYKEFWLNQFKEKAPVLNLPTSYPRLAYRTYESESLNFKVDKEEKAELEKISTGADATLFMAFVALLNIIIYKHSGQNDITIGAPVAGREHPDLENQVGFYVNTLPLRTVIDDTQSFKGFLVDVKNNVLAVLKNQLYPFDQLIEDLDIQFERNRNPLFDIGFTYLKENELNNKQKHTSLANLEVTYIESGFNLVKADIWVKVLDNESDYILSVAYNTALFSPLYVKNLVGDIKQLLATAIANPDHSIAQLISSVVAHEAKLKEEQSTAIKGKNLSSLKSIVKEVNLTQI